jgi:hypothetical protein
MMWILTKMLRRSTEQAMSVDICADKGEKLEGYEFLRTL